MSTTDKDKYDADNPSQDTNTDVRQESARKLNFRVLLASMMLALIFGVLLWALFWWQTPTIPT